VDGNSLGAPRLTSAPPKVLPLLQREMSERHVITALSLRTEWSE